MKKTKIKPTQKKPLLCYQCKEVMQDKPADQQKWQGNYAICDICNWANKTKENQDREHFIKSFLYTLAFVFSLFIIGWALLGNALLLYLLEIIKADLLIRTGAGGVYQMTSLLTILNVAINGALFIYVSMNYVKKMRALK